jgi:hypothetical protein
MQPKRDTARLFAAANNRLERIKKVLPVGVPALAPEVDRATAFVAIELMNQWVQFSRSLYLSSCRGAVDSYGQKITCTVAYQDDNESLRLATNLQRTNPFPPGHILTAKEEPNWLAANFLLRALRHVGASNEQNVATALGLQTRSLTDLPSVRNFYGHRGRDTVRKVLGVNGVVNHYRVGSVAHPTAFCLAYEPTRPLSVLGTWLEDIRTIEEFSCL